MEYEYMVSYSQGGLSGNQCGTLAEVNAYAEANKHRWSSYSFFRYLPVGAVNDLEPCDKDGNPIK